ncbi:TPA: hypothetical protein L4936_001172 [Pseudomonas aeruginosa]|jgi:hypothetical protein|nr:hypothetical protein [Pseudomonas aeruginosa]HBO6962566.1 hypothetical protein [Pseudomonas aeruginosa]HBO7218231.1 hypothetical protein [Pseudomonas aeruginosa]
MKYAISFACALVVAIYVVVPSQESGAVAGIKSAAESRNAMIEELSK